MNNPPPFVARKAALAVEIVSQIIQEVDKGIPADNALRKIFRAHREYGSKDRRFYGNTAFSYFRWKGWLPGQPIEKACAIALLLDTTDLSDELIALCQQAEVKDSKITPLAILSLTEKVIATGKLLDSATAIPIPALIPNGLLPHIAIPQTEKAETYYDHLIDSLQIRPPTWLRFPSAKKALAFVQSQNLDCKIHPNISTAVAVSGNFNRNLLQSVTGRQAEIQDIASQCVGFICDPQPREKWWDVCAGSGGKALHLAALGKGETRIYATDSREVSLSKIKKRAKRVKITNIVSDVLDGAEDTPQGRIFDGILVDAPCSGIGTWARNPDARWRFDLADIQRNAELQKRILANAAQFLRAGGTLIYSVCTCTLEETSAIISGFLATHSEYELIDFKNPLTKETRHGQCSIQPWEGPGNSMFIAKLKRKIIN